MSVELGPGLIGSIYDGIQRPLDDIMRVTGSNLLQRGIEAPSLKREKLWKFEADRQVGEPGRPAATCSAMCRKPTSSCRKSWCPPGVSGTITRIESGEYHVTDAVAVVTATTARSTASP
jgi:V/A-type H+-transporting ATPase subunit A